MGAAAVEGGVTDPPTCLREIAERQASDGARMLRLRV